MDTTPHRYLKDGSFQERLARARFLTKLKSGYEPQAAAAKANLTFARVLADIEAGDSELNDAMTAQAETMASIREPQKRPGQKRGPSADNIRMLTLQLIAPRVLDHLSDRLDELDTSPHSNPKGWKADLEVLANSARMITALMPKEVISDQTIRTAEAEVADMSSDAKAQRLEQLREEKRKLLMERKRAEATEHRVVDFEKEQDSA